MVSNNRTTNNKEVISDRERRLRQELAYFIYYWGGVIDFDNALSLCAIAKQIEMDSDLSPILKSDLGLEEVENMIYVVGILQKLGTKADTETTPQFAYLGNDTLACKELSKGFYENSLALKTNKS